MKAIRPSNQTVLDHHPTLPVRPPAGAGPSRSACEIRLRSAEPDDAMALVEMHRRLSPDSRFYRFLRSHIPTVDELAAICRLQPETGAAYVAAAAADAQSVLGLVYYIINAPPDQQTAEFAIVIDEGLQGKGLGRALFDFLCSQAMESGLARLDAFVHPENRKMRRLLATGRHPVAIAATSGVLEIGIDLRSETSDPPPPAFHRDLFAPAVASAACFSPRPAGTMA